jgi:ribonuclease HI
VRKALFSIGDLKAPGPDGLHAVFYKRFWDMLGEDLADEVLTALNSAMVPNGWNETTIVLIPKVQNPERVTQFRPISLCNVVYKVISKILANRLKQVLPDLISDNQSAFVPGRLITDNILIAYESIHAIKKKQGKRGLCAIKLDMHKAYDRVEWIYLRGIMLKMGFHQRWVDIIMNCVTSVNYNVRFNGMETEVFTPTRGLRQGDPLSPYLFLLVAEGLSCMLQESENSGKLEGVKVCRGAPVISHLLFADDSLILMHADQENARTLREVLDKYCLASGQKVSDDKSSIFFSQNTDVEMKAEVCQILNVMTESLNDKYLGLPAMVGVERSDSFWHLVERVRQRISGWKEKLLSLGGKEVLIKSVAQAIPVYAMMVFRIPQKTCKGISDAISQYWWGDDDEKKRIHWSAWWKMCIPKGKGGMGFRDLQSFNYALLAKQVWRLLCEPESLCARVLRAKYYPDGRLLQAKPKQGSSYTWQSILAGLECFKRGCIWRVGDGNQINIWNDQWIPTSHNMKIQTRRGRRLVTTVNELINPIDGRWDEQLIRDVFWPIDAERILKIPLFNGREDLVAWHFNRNGLFSVRSAYHVQWENKFGSRPEAHQAGGSDYSQVWKGLWELKLPSKIKIFGWRALRGFIPTRGILANKHVGNDSSCPVCHMGCEDIYHLFFNCQRAQAIWRCLGIWDRIQQILQQDRSGSIILAELIRKPEKVAEMEGLGLAELIFTGGWYLWWERRQLVHGEEVQSFPRSAISIVALTMNYFNATKKGIPIGERWKKPPEGLLKLNVDASFIAESGTGSTAAVIRDHTGGWIAGGQNYLHHVADAPTAEAMALRDGLKLAVQIGCNRIIIQSDCMQVVSTMEEGGFSASTAAPIYDECSLLWRDFSSISIEHCNREINMVAHALAKNAVSSKSSCNWADEPPSFLIAILANDVSLMPD